MNLVFMIHASKNKRLYSRRNNILKELRRRRENKDLVLKVKIFFGENYPNFLLDNNTPAAFLSRPIISPNMEVRNFLDIAQHMCLKPIFLEYPGKFVARNKEKYHLAKLKFFDEKNKSQRITSANVTDFNYWEGLELSKVQTKWDQNLMDFHHKAFLSEFPALEHNVFDITDWFNHVRSFYSHYYLAFYALSIVHGVIFENYLFNDSEELKFFKQKAWPSFSATKKYFGVKPLIYPLLPIKNCGDNNWMYYPVEGKKYLQHDI